MSEWITKATIVDGSVFTGLYASDGSFNVVVSDPDEFSGVYHSCGAYWVTGTDQEDHPFYAPNGSVYIMNTLLV